MYDKDSTYKAMYVTALKVELDDLIDISKGRQSIFYGSFYNKNGRAPTKEEIMVEIDRVEKELQEARNG